MRSNIATVLIIILLSCSCSSYQGQSAIADVDIEGWSQPAHITLENGDTTEMFDLDLILRHAPKGVADSIDLLITVTAPDSLQHSDTVRVYPTRDITRYGDIILENIEYRKRVVFNQLGEYQFEISPLKRTKWINAIGLYKK